MLSDVLFYQNYEPAVDVGTIAICIVYWLILQSTYTIKQKSLTMFRIGNILLIGAAASSVFYHYFVKQLTADLVIPVYILRALSYLLLMFVFCVFALYVGNILDLKDKAKKRLNYLTWIPFALFTLWEISTPITKLGFHIDASLKVHENYYYEPFRFFYMYYLILITIQFVTHRKKLVARMYQCIRNIMILSFLVMCIQSFYLQTTFVCLTFTFPILAVLFMFHYNSFDVKTGTLDHYSFNAYIRDLRNKKFSIICLNLNETDDKKIKKLSEHFYHFTRMSFNKPCVFRIRDVKLLMVYDDDLNPDAARLFPLLLEEFDKLYQTYRIDYKIVLIHSDIVIVEGDEYLALNDFILEQLPNNSAYHCKNRDIEDFLKSSYILGELKDIHLKNDLDDPRIKVYCQPVLNTDLNVFNSAEALMRIQLKECGLIYPDQFIPLAEKNGYIHTLSKIILNKTCKQIKRFEAHNYKINRVSVNFSIQELKDKDFCKDVIEIIRQNDIAFDKIAIELTESRNEADFEMVKNVMNRLQRLGIKFYLDDFGTGYSNFERITSLPIDIIKFDRSLTILANKSEQSRFLVGSFSDIFKQSNYQILFEGVEDDQDENQCLEMNASFLQGFKYSKPIPIECLEEFLEKEVILE